MALNRLTEDVNVISKLDNYPPDDPGMTPDKLKSLFDKGSNTIKDYINNTLLPQLEQGYVSSIARTSGDGSPGSTDTYTITFHDGTATTFDIYNGVDGVKGDKGDTGEQGVPGLDGKSLEFHWNGTQLGIRIEGETTYQYVNLKGAKGDTGSKGESGDDGRGIVSIARTSGTGAAGTTDTYTITFTDSTTATFQVYNGADGEGSGDMMQAVYDPTGKNTDIFGYVDNKVKTDVPSGAKFTDTITTINGKTGAISKADITALGIPAQDTVTTINGKTGAISKADIVALGIPSQDTNTTYSEITTAEIDTGTASTLRTITGRRVKYILDKVQGWIGNLTKADVGLDSVDNVKQATKVEFDEHKADGASHSKTARFIIGTSTSGWTAADCDYLCDGTNDQEEIIQALNDLPATGGEVVILDGTYNIAAKIDVTKDNVSIRGNGNATILKRMFNSSTAEGVITLIGRSDCKIANLQVDGNKTSYTSYSNYGIYLASSSNNTITGNTCNSNFSGISLSSSSSNNTVTCNTCNWNNRGISLSSSSNSAVTCNTCNWNNRGISLSSSSSNNTVTCNTCNDNDYSGIYLASSSNNAVTNNTCNSNLSGIYLASSSNNTITGNTCSNNSDGIYLASSSNSAVTCNTCNDNDYSGISLSSSRNNAVTGNTCIRGTGLSTDYTASQHTIRIEGTGNNYNLISNNNCMGKAVTSEGGTGNILVNNVYDGIDYAIVNFVTVSPAPPDKGLWLEVI
jgi:parallel beta-helix repeat protein